ncbi:alpha-N-acetylglucosaminidase TIM-barrel domain-containing protein [Kribbella shirazensis]|uniref:Alpha-N-acetylglucosaminidase n=1 Tax=Kribbella shirazensis TaxID=1105143 RepID=A0A7X5VBD9_9ACTN|nr:alpha-N-acetylglucosaminidase TIM-barrel domain-containing protein [Kribbella shirazensis]NIK57323.1 alpha-N-acetylglucosaminidase [Kribbella shirazensis]
MRRHLLAVTLPLALLATIAPTAHATPPPWDTSSVQALIQRLVPAHAHQVELRALPPTGEYYDVDRRGENVRISATGPSAMLAGFNAYLAQVARVDVSWNGDSLSRLPGTLPLPEQPLHQSATVANRFALNDTDDGYTGAYRTWADWQREIDVLALHGINQVFVPVGAEAVYLDTFGQFGYSEEELLRWIPQPSHQPWWLLQNMSSFPAAVTADQVRQRADLGRKIVTRLRELGITPVLPGYFGTVPPGFAAKVAGARIVPQGNWVGFQRPDWLDPTSPPYADVAKAFYASSERLFGRSTHYKMDLLHEGGQPGPVPVGPASKAVQDALETARPGGTWVFLGWQNNPRPDTLAAIDRSRILIVDGLSDRTDQNRNKTWPDSTYAFGSIWNFGGHTTIGAATTKWEDRFWRWRSETGSKLDGIAVMPEASDNNPAAFDYLTGLAWRNGPVDRDTWFRDWSQRRYGGSDAAAATGWNAIGRTAYSLSGNSEAQDGLYAARPSLTARTAATWSPGSMQYDATDFAAALPALLSVETALRGSSAYRYDLMDVTRQVLSNRSRTLLPRLKTAYDAKDLATFDKLKAQWLEQMALLEQVAATNPQTMLGPWLDKAGDESLKRSARTLLTVWGTRAGFNAGLGDYANREWSGLIGTYYAPRWKAYLDDLSAALRDNRAPSTFDWYQRGADWAAASVQVPLEPTGDIHQIAQQVLSYLIAHPEPVSLTATASPVNVPDNTSTTVTVNLRNTDPFRTASGVEVALSAPADSGLTVQPQSVVVPELAPGARTSVSFTVTATGPAARLTTALTARTAETVTTVRIVRAGPVQAPNRTITTNNAVFAQSGDAYLIEGAGNDMWGTTKQFGAIYQPNALPAGGSLVTRVVAQDRTGPWARAGLVVSPDLTRTGSAGIANVAITPDNGCVYSWDSDGNGTLDQFRNVTGRTAPQWLRLTRAADTITAACSVDGTTWTTVGSSVVPAGAVLDGGLFMSAANGGAGTRGAAEFSGFTLGAPAPASNGG